MAVSRTVSEILSVISRKWPNFHTPVLMALWGVTP